MSNFLNGELCTTFGATSPNNCATSTSLHAHQKTVRAFPLGYGGLVCAFHEYSLAIRKARYYKALSRVCQVNFRILSVDKFPYAM